ncbi:hypothetical protein CYLTODRAFT_350626 [Cylindrobasidium torrendii FP15055 ss-10]|uniref:HECT-type E3 ubiquitin transferase n=1 Tax=Cylindrobasidium torrendii FP15055 ss-10 TaxID=1314674 RepID=A0A0D7BEF6_9AGAR|nr:hypothetical protein CYLTODRAFT_350626 [Cylindrobasidium torrendii FP15055 ss-10]
MAHDVDHEEQPAAESAAKDNNAGDGDDHDAHDDDEPENDEDNPESDPAPSSGNEPPPPGGLDDSAALAIFGDYRQFGSFMMGLGTRLKTMLNNIKSTADPTTRLVTLQELSELLSISTEDTLAGSFQVEDFVRELIKILGGSGSAPGEHEGDDEEHEQDEDAALAAAIALSTGGSIQGDSNLEAQVLACRCLANLMEALPGVAHTVVYHGAVPVLCSKLLEISYIDLAEQTLSTMEKISEEFPSAIVREGGLAALLNYLDFFSIAVQRTALQAAANCCRNISPDHFNMLVNVWPIIRNCLTYSDQRLVEYACMCVIRVIDAYHRAYTHHLEVLVDKPLIGAVNQLLMPAGGSPMIASNTYTLLLRALATAVRGSPKIAIALLEADIVDTLYQILTGVLPPVSIAAEQGGSSDGQGLGGGVADMTVMENLAHRPKEQVEEALSLISELLPPLPKDGVFDAKAYSEKALLKMAKAKAKADRAAARVASGQAAPSSVTPSAPVAADTPAPDDMITEAPTPSGTQTPQMTEESVPVTQVQPTPPDRTEMLRGKPEVVNRFMHLMVPILIDVYAASVNTPVRLKTLTGLLKAVSFLDADGIKGVLTFVPVASFSSSILSSKDEPRLVIGALQLVDILLAKAPALYKPTFRREGVFHEIETLAARVTAASKREKAEKEKAKETGNAEGSSETTTPVPPPVIPGLKKLSSTMLDSEDVITLRARVIRFKYLSGDSEEESDEGLSALKTLVASLSPESESEEVMIQALWQLAELFSSPHTSVSSFELLQSGVVDALLKFATDPSGTVSLLRRREILLDALVMRKSKHLHDGQTPFVTFVKKLQESLTRMESFDVVTVSQGADDSKRSSPSLLARQLRLRLTASDESGIPKNLHNIVVSIHAIATFQALHDYLRPRVAGLSGSGDRLSSMLAALAASGFPGSSRFGEPPAPAPPPAAAGSSVTAASGSASAPLPGSSRRRSQRLTSKKSSASLQDEPMDAVPTGVASGSGDAGGSGSGKSDGVAETNAEVPRQAPSDNDLPPPADPLLDAEMHGADVTDDEEEEIDAEVFDDDDDEHDNSISDKTVSLSVAEDGTKVEAQTPDGTRVATPMMPAGPSRTTSSNKISYANALKAKPQDWHMEFSMDDHPLPLDLTIYGAIHQNEMRKNTGPISASTIWQGVYTIKFKKVAGPLPTTDANRTESTVRSRNQTTPLSSLPEDAPHAKILRLLRVLHQLNTMEGERVGFETRNLSEAAFVNNKLTAKLTRQLEEPMIVASFCLPDWALDLPQHFPFLFPFATRYNFLQSTSFGYARLILKWQSQQGRNHDSSRRDDGIGFLGRLQRQKVRISRKHILESAVKVFELYGSSSSVLEVEYFEEVGTGLGPTLEFYSLVSREFARKDLKLWRDADASATTMQFVHHPTGLYPAPLSPEAIAGDGGHKRTQLFKVTGQFVAKAMLDSRIIDLSFNKVFMKLVLGEEVPVTMATLKLVDVDLANSLTKLQEMADKQNQVDPSDTLAVKTAMVEGINVEDLALDFTVPGYDIELKPEGRDIPVTADNVNEYIAAVLDVIVGQGVALPVKAFREGFSKVFPIMDLQAFSADELVMLFGNSDEDWSSETLSEAMKADHGFNPESRSIRHLLEIFSEFDVTERRNCLQFVTGSPKLPIGGFRGLNPPLTVVRKPHEAPLTADDYLPSVMTCVNYLKLPEYSSKEVMKAKLLTAIREGTGSFHLS